MALTVAVLLTCHNRRETTLECLGAVAAQRSGAQVEAVVVDAGSRDGTPDAIDAKHPWVAVLRASSDLYWNSGMRVAWSRAERFSPDHYLWLNDDVVLDDDALAALLRCEHEVRSRVGAPAIIVGTTRDPVSGEPTYGGVQRSHRWHPLRFQLVPPCDRARPAETMNGNCVLVPAEVAERLGSLDPAFTHAIGDFDYGLRATASGFSVWVAPGTIGTCARNPMPQDTRIGRLRRLGGPKGLPPSQWARFCHRWAGPLWPLYFAGPYIRSLTNRTRAVR